MKSKNSSSIWLLVVTIMAGVGFFVMVPLMTDRLTTSVSSSQSLSNNPVAAKHYNSKTPFVEDNANKLSETTRNRIADLNQNATDVPGHPQLLVVTVDSLKGIPISDLAVEKGKQYGIGAKDANSGLVYVLAVKEHKDFLATGYGMESHITDAMATKMLDSDDSHTPFRDGDYDKGINAILSKIQPYFLGDLKASDYSKSNSNTSADNDSSMMMPFVIISTLIMFVFVAIDDNVNSWVTRKDGGPLGSNGRKRSSSEDDDDDDWHSSSSSYSYSSSSSSSSDWSGGGGDFGGGGGGSSW